MRSEKINDVRQGLVSVDAAKDIYGVIINELNWTIDEDATQGQRSFLNDNGEAE